MSTFLVNVCCYPDERQECDNLECFMQIGKVEVIFHVKTGIPSKPGDLRVPSRMLCYVMLYYHAGKEV